MGINGREYRTGLIAKIMSDSAAQLAATTWRRAEVGHDDPLDAYAAV